MSDSPIIGVTYNSGELEEFRLWRLMFQGVVAAGGTPLALDCAVPNPRVAELASRVDGLILSGGGDVDPATYGFARTDPLVWGINRHRDRAEHDALKAARARGLPVLAICRGAQLVNVALGGTLHLDLERDWSTELGHRRPDEDLSRTQHTVDVVSGSRLAQWLSCAGVVAVNSQHHQGVRELGVGLVATATSPDGLVEGFELPDEPVVGVQWHPEVLWKTHPHAGALLASLVRTSAWAAQARAGAAFSDPPTPMSAASGRVAVQARTIAPDRLPANVQRR